MFLQNGSFDLVVLYKWPLCFVPCRIRQTECRIVRHSSHVFSLLLLLPPKLDSLLPVSWPPLSSLSNFLTVQGPPCPTTLFDISVHCSIRVQFIEQLLHTRFPTRPFEWLSQTPIGRYYSDLHLSGFLTIAKILYRFCLQKNSSPPTHTPQIPSSSFTLLSNQPSGVIFDSSPFLIPTSSPARSIALYSPNLKKTLHWYFLSLEYFFLRLSLWLTLSFL